MTPLLEMAWKPWWWGGFREDAKESARVAAEADVAADETKADAAGAEPASGISRLATLVGLVADELWHQPLSLLFLGWVAYIQLSLCGR
jgi:hypothetical protein